MANAVHPYGFRWVEDPHGTSCTPRVRQLVASGGESGLTLYRGQPVTLSAGYLIASTGDGSVGDLVGICNEYVILAASVLKQVPVILAHNAYFEVQTDADFVCADVDAFLVLAHGNKYDIGSPTSGRSNGCSAAVLDGTGGGQALNIVDYPLRPDNEFGPYMDVIVRFDESQFRGQPDFVVFD
jgi:hypothetical protein